MGESVSTRPPGDPDSAELWIGNPTRLELLESLYSGLLIWIADPSNATWRANVQAVLDELEPKK